MFSLARVLLLSFAVVVASFDTCDQTCCGKEWLGYGGFCYRYFTFQKTWQDARNYCLVLGADLASIHSTGENNVINGLVGGESVGILL